MSPLRLPEAIIGGSSKPGPMDWLKKGASTLIGGLPMALGSTALDIMGKRFLARNQYPDMMASMRRAGLNPMLGASKNMPSYANTNYGNSLQTGVSSAADAELKDKQERKITFETEQLYELTELARKQVENTATATRESEERMKRITQEIENLKEKKRLDSARAMELLAKTENISAQLAQLQREQEIYGGPFGSLIKSIAELMDALNIYIAVPMKGR